jgi:antitoxin ChpS
VVLADGDWRFWDEKGELAGLAYDVLIDDGLMIHPWPVSQSSWEDPTKHDNRYFIETLRRDGRSLVAVA